MKADERIKGVVFKNCVPFINCIIEIDNIGIHIAKDIDTVMPIYNLTEYSANYSKTSRRLWQYYRDEPNDNLNDSELFKSEIKLTETFSAGGNRKYVEIIAPLKQNLKIEQ